MSGDAVIGAPKRKSIIDTDVGSQENPTALQRVTSVGGTLFYARVRRRCRRAAQREGGVRLFSLRRAPHRPPPARCRSRRGPTGRAAAAGPPDSRRGASRHSGEPASQPRAALAPHPPASRLRTPLTVRLALWTGAFGRRPSTSCSPRTFCEHARTQPPMSVCENYGTVVER